MRIYASSPLVSVIIPAYNAEAFIKETLDSVLAQTYRDLEVIVVDDGSRDHTIELVQKVAHQDRRLRIIQQDNQGVAAARNVAIQRSSGELIAPLDADDIWYPDKIKKQVRCMLGSPDDVGVIYAWSAAMAPDGGLYGAASCSKHEGYVFTPHLYQNFIGNASVPLIRRECLDRVGGYDPQLRARGAQGCEDWDLTLRLAEFYKFGVVPEFLVGYRQLDTSMSANADGMARSYMMVLEKVRQRRRDIPRHVFRWSAGHFYLYLMWKSYLAGDLRGTLKWIFKGLQNDPALIAAPNTLRFLTRSLLRLSTQPVTSALWPTRETWLNWKSRHLTKPFQKRTLSAVTRDYAETAPTENAYERLAMRRMRQLAGEL